MKKERDKEICKEIHYIYILECADKSLYTGWTTSLEKRLKTHNEGKGAKYTKSRLPVCLRYYETFSEKSEALRREWEIKKMPRAKKLALISEQKKKGKSVCETTKA